MAYRSDARVPCARCSRAIAEGQGELSKSGETLCRVCANTQRIADSAEQLALSAAPAWAPDRPDSKLGYWALAPIAFFTLWCLAQLTEHLLKPRSCSELACLGLTLVPMAGIVVTVPCAIIAVMRVPAAARRRVAFACFGAALLMLGSCIAPL